MSSITFDASYIDSTLCVSVTAHLGAGAIRRPFHLALLIDGSGSMAGDRMDEVIRTLHRLIDVMNPMDSVSLILYHSTARIILNSVEVGTDHSALHTAIDSLRADGGTNLGAGLLQIPSLKTVPDSVIILTDGQINEGFRQSSEILSLIRSILPHDTPIHTLGFGADHNQILLRDLAKTGTYTYIDIDELISTIWGDILGGLESEVGRGAELMVPTGWKIFEVGADPSLTTFSIGRLIDAKKHWVVLEPLTSGQAVPSAIQLRWSDGITVRTHEAIPAVATVPLDIEEQRLRAHTAIELRKITDFVQESRRTEALEALKTLKTLLDASAVKDRILILQFRAQIDGMVDLVTRSTTAYNPILMSRLASTEAYAGHQAGILSIPLPPDGPPSMNRTASAYSTPHQIRTSSQMTENPSNSAAASVPDSFYEN
jgi:hypothetical protein